MRLVRPLILASLAAAAITASACGVTKTYHISEERFAPIVAPEEVRLFLGETVRPYTQVAYINSVVSEDKTVRSKRVQLEDLQRRAASLGADAVVDIQLLTERHQAMIPDSTVPFPAWEQGRYRRYFLRGVAVRLMDPEEAAELEWEERRAGLTEEELRWQPTGPGISEEAIENIREVEAPREERQPHLHAPY